MLCHTLNVHSLTNITGVYYHNTGARRYELCGIQVAHDLHRHVVQSTLPESFRTTSPSTGCFGLNWTVSLFTTETRSEDSGNDLLHLLNLKHRFKTK